MPDRALSALFPAPRPRRARIGCTHGSCSQRWAEVRLADIVIDPGHGGTHPAGHSTPWGTRGPSGIHEKDVTLRLALRVAAHLGRSAVLTRGDDVNLSLAARAARARAEGARIFVSLHADDQ